MESYSASAEANASWSPSSAASANAFSSVHSRLAPNEGSMSSYFSSARFTSSAVW